MRSAILFLTALGLVTGGSAAPAVERPPQPTVTLPAALAILFAEDGFVLSSGNPPVRGRAQIEKHYSGSGGPLSLRALAFATEGSRGYVIGGFSREKGEPDVGKFTLTLRKGPKGRWLIMSDMDNGNSRP